MTNRSENLPGVPRQLPQGDVRVGAAGGVSRPDAGRDAPRDGRDCAHHFQRGRAKTILDSRSAAGTKTQSSHSSPQALAG